MEVRAIASGHCRDNQAGVYRCTLVAVTDPTAVVPIPANIIQAARESGRAVRAAVARKGGAPLRDGNLVTLLYHGVADVVRLYHWLDIFPPIPDFTLVPGTKLWWTQFELGPDARVEYKISIERNTRRRLTVDTYNTLVAPNPWGLNSVVIGAKYAEPSWAKFDPAVAAGGLITEVITSPLVDAPRIARLYTPPTGDPVPLLVVHDGSDYLDFTGLASVLDNLIAAGDIPPVAAVFTDPVDRFGEYRASNRHAAYLVEELIPAVEQHTGVSSRIAMGASLGGVASLHAAWTHPGVFDGLILQAGSFVRALGGPHARSVVFRPVINFMERFLSDPGTLPTRIHLSCGLYDGLVDDNRWLAEQLSHTEVAVGHAEVASGHDWHGWRDLLRPALMHTLGSPEPGVEGE